MKTNEWIGVIIVMIIVSIIVSLITSSLAVKKSPLLSPDDDGSGIDTSGTPAPTSTDVVDPIYRNREYQVINSLTISDPDTVTIGKLVADMTDKKSVYLQQIADGGNLVFQKKGAGTIVFKIDDNKIMTISPKGIWAGVIIEAIYGKFVRYSPSEDGVLELGESSYASGNNLPSIIRGEGGVMNITFTEKTLTGVSVNEIKLSSSGSINLNGKVNLSAIKSGTTGDYVCIDSSGLLFKKSTPCK